MCFDELLRRNDRRSDNQIVNGVFGYLGPSKEYRVPNNDKAIVIEMDKALLLT